MYVYVPDPNPGRCLNHRWRRDGQMVRCLDYEGVEHVCSFEEPPPRSWTDQVHVSTTWKHKQPEPWVKPGDENRDSE